MEGSVKSLFELSHSKVTNKDIVDFVPGDPGYDDYVKVWTEILNSGQVPEKSHFDLSEVISLTGFANPKEEEKAEDLERFLNFRRFTSAVAMVLMHSGNDSEMVRPLNYLLRDFIVDAPQGDKQYLELLCQVFVQTREYFLSKEEEIEYPFITFGLMVLAQKLEDYEQSQNWAAKLIDDESKVRSDERVSYLVQSDQFLLGITNYDQFHRDWKLFASQLENPKKDEQLQLVIESI